MNTSTFSKALLIPTLLFSSSLLADHVTLSGLFNGSEPMLAPFSGTCSEPDKEAMLGYLQLGPVQVSSTGLYDITDAGNWLPQTQDVVMRVYEGSFDPQNPGQNQVGPSVDETDQMPLEAGPSYVIVIQHWCYNGAGAYGVALSGSGNITGTGVVDSPDHTLGTFGSSDPVADFGGLEPNIYNLNGPITMPESGTYYFSDLSRNSTNNQRLDMELWIYKDAFDPQDPGSNVVAYLDDQGSAKLEAGTNYYFVTTPWNEGEYGEWHYALFPPGAPRFNIFLGGAWYNKDTDGQGILMQVFPSYNFVFLAWYTFEDLPPIMQSAEPPSKTEAIGDSTQRWFSAYGEFAPGASSMELTYENTTGGAFNILINGQGKDLNYGTGALRVNDCNSVELDFNIPDAMVQGTNYLTRVADPPDPITLAACEELGLQAGVIE